MFVPLQLSYSNSWRLRLYQLCGFVPKAVICNPIEDIDWSARAPAFPKSSTGALPIVDGDELLDWYHAGALELQQFDLFDFDIVKGVDTVLGPLYYTDRHVFQVVESVVREAPAYIERFLRVDPDSPFVHYLIWGDFGSYEAPLFYLTIVFGLGNAWGWNTNLHGLIFKHYRGYHGSQGFISTSSLLEAISREHGSPLFCEVRRGGFTWEKLHPDPYDYLEEIIAPRHNMGRVTRYVDLLAPIDPIMEAQPLLVPINPLLPVRPPVPPEPITLHIPERRPPAWWRWDSQAHYVKTLVVMIGTASLVAFFVFNNHP